MTLNTPARGRWSYHVHAIPNLLSFFLWLVLHDVDLILGFNSGAVPRMGLRPVAPTPFGSCCFSFFIIV